MNIAFLLTPKASVSCLYDDCTVRQGLEKMKAHGYTSIPVITRDNKYAGAVSEGDFLWYLVRQYGDTPLDIGDTDGDLVKDILESIEGLDSELTGYDQDEIIKELDDTPPNVEFKEYDESTADDVEFITCPECGHKFPK